MTTPRIIHCPFPYPNNHPSFFLILFKNFTVSIARCIVVVYKFSQQNSLLYVCFSAKIITRFIYYFFPKHSWQWSLALFFSLNFFSLFRVTAHPPACLLHHDSAYAYAPSSIPAACLHELKRRACLHPCPRTLMPSPAFIATCKPALPTACMPTALALGARRHPWPYEHQCMPTSRGPALARTHIHLPLPLSYWCNNCRPRDLAALFILGKLFLLICLKITLFCLDFSLSFILKNYTLY